MPWDPEKYHQFKKERSAPFEDLFSLINIRPGLSVIDLGCGTGELTAELASRLPGSEVLGLDTSAEMLGRAHLLEQPGLRFELGRLEKAAGQWDLVFSHAAIHWVSGHRRLVPRLFSLVKPGGQLVVQQPSNHHHPAHQLIRETAREEPFRTALGGWTRRVPVLPVDIYARLLYDQGAQDLVVFEKVYPHILADADALVDWLSGTTLVPYFERLDPEMRAQFTRRFRQKLWAAWPHGPVFYGFRRILFAARHP